MIRYHADLLITQPGNAAPISDGVVDVEQGRVVWSGPRSEAPPLVVGSEQMVDGILMPGMVDIHCHTPMVMLRGAGEGLPVDRWLSDVMWPREAKLTPDDVRVGMEVGAAQLLRNGITTSVEMYFHTDAVAEGAEAAGLRCLVTPPVLVDDQLEAFGTWQAQLDGILATNDRWADHSLIDVGIGPHAAYSLPDDAMRAIAGVAAERDLLVHIHVAEQEWEESAIRETTGMAAPEYLESIGMLESRLLAAHSVWMSDRDIETFATHGVAVAHCPCSNTKHASGIARVDDMLDAGIRVGIATDGPASHHRLDLFEEMRTAIRLARVSSGDAQRFPTDRALRMVTSDAADAIDRSDLGRLTAGSRADMIAITMQEPALHPVIRGDDDPIARIVWSGSPSAVTDVWVEGRQVVADRVVTTIDVGKATEEMTNRASRLAQ